MSYNGESALEFYGLLSPDDDEIELPEQEYNPETQELQEFDLSFAEVPPNAKD